jgi:hypothetical protein
VDVDAAGVPHVDVRLHVHEAVRAVLSDDHNHERGVQAAREVAEAVLARSGPAGLVELVVATSLELAQAVEQVAAERRLAAADLAEVWFAG